MNRQSFLAFLRSVFDVQEREMLCSEFFEALPRYVDWVEAGRRAAADEELAGVAHHLDQCPECREAYEALLVVTRASR